MRLSKLFPFCLLFFMIFRKCVSAVEPFSTGLAVGVAVAFSSLYAGFDVIKCRFSECCNEEWIKPNISGLAVALKQKLHGQHLVSDTVLKAIRGHLEDSQPPKALVLSFHGWTGGGKNFVSRIIADHLYQQGMQSGFVHLFIATLHFPHASKIELYKTQLSEWIQGNVSLCSRSLFIFDEMDKMHPGIIDAIKPFIDYYVEVGGIDYRKSVFLFLSNAGGTAITEVALNFWESGMRREDIVLKDLDDILNVDSFNEQGGLRRSTLIERNLIDAFIPFLPMERQHVKLCIKDSLKEKGYELQEELINEVANELSYFPPDKQLYSRSGCKRVNQKVNLVIGKSGL